MSFLQYAQTPSGHFHNFMGFDRKFRDEHGSDDTLGRAVWGLGCVVRHRSGEGVGALAQEMLRRALEPARALRSPRGWAYVITGLALALSRHKEHQEYRQVLSELAGRLLARYQAAATPDWRWFEERITYRQRQNERGAAVSLPDHRKRALQGGGILRPSTFSSGSPGPARTLTLLETRAGSNGEKTGRSLASNRSTQGIWSRPAIRPTR